MKTTKWVALLIIMVFGLMICSPAFAESADGRIELYINGIEEETDELIAQYKPQFDGQEVRLSIGGEYGEALRFLKAMDFGALDLDWQFSDFYLPSEESGEDRGLFALDHLKALTIRDTSYGYFRLEDVYADLEELTLICEDESQVFGMISSRQAPNLKTLRVETTDPDTVMLGNDMYMVFPAGLETIEIRTPDGEVPAGEITSANLIGSLLYCCPGVRVNGAALQELKPASEGDLSAEEFVELAKTNAAIVSVLDSVYFGSDQASQELPRVNGKLLIANLSYYDTFYLYDCSYRPFGNGWTYYEQATPEEMIAFYGTDMGQPDWVPREIPPELLANGVDDADTLVVIYETMFRVRDDVKYDTAAVIADLRTGTVYAPYSVNPPGVYDVEGGCDLAVSQVMQSYGGEVAQAAIGRERFGGGTASVGTGGADDDTMIAVITALDKQIYYDTLQALQNGETITQGTYSTTAYGLQQTLADFGCDISLDGNAGPGTFQTLNGVLEAFGMEHAEAVDADLYSKLLSLLLISTKGEEARSILYDANSYDDGQFDYLQACALYAQGRYYSAKEAFEYSMYKDYQERAAACEQPWPQNGEIWHNPGYYSQSMVLTFIVNSYDGNRGMYFEVFSENDDLAASLFITGSGSASTYLPGGNYRIKDGTGYEWYGMKDTFGPDGDYEYMIFNEFDYDDRLTSLPSGYEWTISVNTGSGGTGVGSESVGWGG